MRKKFITGAAVLALLMNSPQVSAEEDVVIFGGEFDNETPAQKKIDKPAPKKELPPKPKDAKPKDKPPENSKAPESKSPSKEIKPTICRRNSPLKNKTSSRPWKQISRSSRRRKSRAIRKPLMNHTNLPNRRDKLCATPITSRKKIWKL